MSCRSPLSACGRRCCGRLNPRWRTGAPTATEVYLETGKKRVFCCAYEWPGWCRSGRDEESALATLRAYLPRYAVVTRQAKLPTPDAEFVVLERLPGGSGTDFGIPAAITSRDGAASEAARKLVAAAWAVFDEVVRHAPAELRKGPRGGGRDRDKMVDHVLSAEPAYAARMQLKLRQPSPADKPSLEAFREAILDRLKHPEPDAPWPPAYAARRIAWHALDHAWEIEDRSLV